MGGARDGDWVGTDVGPSGLSCTQDHDTPVKKAPLTRAEVWARGAGPVMGGQGPVLQVKTGCPFHCAGPEGTGDQGPGH